MAAALHAYAVLSAGKGLKVPYPAAPTHGAVKH